MYSRPQADIALRIHHVSKRNLKKLPAFRSLYFNTMFGASWGVGEVAKPNLKLLEPVSMTDFVREVFRAWCNADRIIE